MKPENLKIGDVIYIVRFLEKSWTDMKIVIDEKNITNIIENDNNVNVYYDNYASVLKKGIPLSEQKYNLTFTPPMGITIRAAKYAFKKVLEENKAKEVKKIEDKYSHYLKLLDKIKP